MKRFVCLFLLVFLTAPAFPQNPEIVPNENLVVEGIPKIPASLAETVERYTNFRGASLDSWDPVKREMLISTRFADTAQIHLVKMPVGARATDVLSALGQRRTVFNCLRQFVCVLERYRRKRVFPGLSLRQRKW